MVSPHSFHIASPLGSLAAIHYRPAESGAHREDMLFLHGFSHELYNARPVMAALWRNLAATGVGVLSVDLPGCGDSYGESGDADWRKWLATVDYCHGWLVQLSNRPISIGGMRLGCPLALESAAGIRWKRILLLQPVISGHEMMTQFLRLRVAFSGLRDIPEERETTETLRRQLLKGIALEVAGYALVPELVRDIDRIDLNEVLPPAHSPIAWLETGREAEMLAARGTVAKWKNRKVSVRLVAVDVKPYWLHTRGAASEYNSLATAVCAFFGE